jgi:hypothetical protein
MNPQVYRACKGASLERFYELIAGFYLQVKGEGTAPAALKGKG